MWAGRAGGRDWGGSGLGSCSGGCGWWEVGSGEEEGGYEVRGDKGMYGREWAVLVEEGVTDALYALYVGGM